MNTFKSVILEASFTVSQRIKLLPVIPVAMLFMNIYSVSLYLKVSFGTLKVSGYLRGQALSVNGLVHIPGWDTYQMIQIDAPTDPYPLHQRNAKSNLTKNMVCVNGKRMFSG